MALWGFCFTCLNYVGNPTQQFLTSGASFLTDHNNRLHVHLLCFAELTIAQTFMLLFYCITSYSSQEWILVHYWNMEWRNQIKPLFIYCDKFSIKKVWETQRGIIQANNDNNQLFFFLHLNFELNSVIQFQQQQQIKIFRKNEKITGLG